MRGKLGLLVHHIIMVISHQGPIVCVEELLSGVLYTEGGGGHSLCGRTALWGAIQRGEGDIVCVEELLSGVLYRGGGGGGT